MEKKTVISKKQNKNEPCKTVVLQPKYVNVVFDRSQKSILGRAKPKEFHAVFEADNISSQYMNMAVKSCVQNTSIEKTDTQVSECKQKIIPALMRIPNGSPIVLRNNNVRKVTLIKPESIVKPNIAVKNSNDRINLNGCAPSGTPENTSQQLSPDPSAGTHEIIRQELSPDASNKTHDFHKIISNVSPVLYNMSNTSTRNKKFIVEVTNQEKMTSNFQRSTKNLDDTEASREPPINSDTSVTTDFQNKSFDTMRLNVVPRYAHSTKPQPLLPAPSVQNTRSVLSIPSGQHSRPLLPTPTVQNAYLVTGFPPNQYVRLVKAPNYSGRSRPVYVSHQPTGSSSRYSSYQPLQSFIASGQNTRHDIEGHLIRSDILGSQSVRPTVVVNQFNTGRGICTINPGIRQPSSLLSTNTGFQYGPSASVNSVRFGGRFYSGPNSRLSRIQTPPGRRVL